MATKGGNRGESGNTRIRFIMLEADGNATDLHQIAQAITNAVRPTTFIQQMAAPPVMAAALPGNGHQQVIPGDPDLHPSVEIVDEGVTTSPSTARKSPAKKYRPRVPVVLELDLTGGEVPFLAYYQEKNPSDHSKRYLVIAAWFKLHRQIDEIGIDHIYTCYRTLSMNVVPDVGNIFRNCKRRGWFNSGSQPGCFSITHVGINEVNNLSNSQ